MEKMEEALAGVPAYWEGLREVRCCTATLLYCYTAIVLHCYNAIVL